MDDITFKDTRFDPDIIEFHGIAKQMAASVGYTAEMGVEKKLAQLLRLRVAQMNECSYCLILHTKAAHDQGVHPPRSRICRAGARARCSRPTSKPRWPIARG